VQLVDAGDRLAKLYEAMLMPQVQLARQPHNEMRQSLHALIEVISAMCDTAPPGDTSPHALVLWAVQAIDPQRSATVRTRALDDLQKLFIRVHTAVDDFESRTPWG